MCTVFLKRPGGAHVFAVRSEVRDTIIAGTRNHYTDLRSYFCLDPSFPGAKWTRVTIMHNGRILKHGTPAEIENDAEVQAIYMGGRREGSHAA